MARRQRRALQDKQETEEVKTNPEKVCFLISVQRLCANPDNLFALNV